MTTMDDLTYYPLAMCRNLIGLVISTLINNQVTLDARIALYSIGDLIAFAACAIAMSLQERRSNKPAGWGTLYPRAFAALSFIGEIGIMILSINILHRGEPFSLSFMKFGSTNYL
jgi:hypothetical protein